MLGDGERRPEREVLDEQRACELLLVVVAEVGEAGSGTTFMNWYRFVGTPRATRTKLELGVCESIRSPLWPSKCSSRKVQA